MGVSIGGIGIGSAITPPLVAWMIDRKSTRLNSSHRTSSYAVVCLKKKKQTWSQPGSHTPRLLKQNLPACPRPLPHTHLQHHNLYPRLDFSAHPVKLVQ